MARIPEICKGYSEEEIETFKKLQKISLERLGYAYCRCEMHPIKEKENMKFDKSKILTVVTADQAKVGSMGYFSNYIPALKKYVTGEGYNKHAKLTRVMLDAIYPFFDGYNHYSLFYPAQEPTYTERQAEWIKENNVKEGTKVRVTRTFTKDEDGSCCLGHDDLVGMTGSVYTYDIVSHILGVIMSDGKLRVIPYFALEVIKEPTYEERQAEWIKENNVKVGMKVRFTKDFKTAEDGSRCCEHRDVKGKEGAVSGIHCEVIYVEMGPFDIWACPFTALEVIKEPTYRSYNNDELNDLVGEVLTNKQSGRKKLVTGKPTASEGVNLDGSYISAKDLLASFYRNTDKPCGVREDD